VFSDVEVVFCFYFLAGERNRRRSRRGGLNQKSQRDMPNAPSRDAGVFGAWDYRVNPGDRNHVF